MSRIKETRQSTKLQLLSLLYVLLIGLLFPEAPIRKLYPRKSQSRKARSSANGVTDVKRVCCVCRILNEPTRIDQFNTDVRRGIKYSSKSLDSLICLQCNLWICRKCRYVHTTLHSQRIQVELRQWVVTSSDFDPMSTCNKCSKPALARLQCKSQDCSQSLCLACFQNSISLDKFLEEHFEKFPTHKEFVAIHPEEWYVTEAWSQNPCECLTYVFP
jgi:hypothetical protein